MLKIIIIIIIIIIFIIIVVVIIMIDVIIITITVSVIIIIITIINLIIIIIIITIIVIIIITIIVIIIITIIVIIIITIIVIIIIIIIIIIVITITLCKEHNLKRVNLKILTRMHSSFSTEIKREIIRIKTEFTMCKPERRWRWTLQTFHTTVHLYSATLVMPIWRTTRNCFILFVFRYLEKFSKTLINTSTMSIWFF